MTATDTPRRISWLDRQRLEAADLNDRAGREAFTRRLHTSVVHDAWGVALGFGIQVGSDGGAPTVLPGWPTTGSGARSCRDVRSRWCPRCPRSTGSATGSTS